MNNINKVKLVCFDFDQTLSPNHITSALNKKGLSYPDGVGIFVNGKLPSEDLKLFGLSLTNAEEVKEAEEVEEVKGAGKVKEEVEKLFNAGEIFPEVRKNEVVETIKDLLQKGIKVAITSNCQFPSMIPTVLELLGFTEEERGEIIVITGGGLPKNFNELKKDKHYKGAFDLKNPHIKIAMISSDVEEYENVVLIDDDKTNIIAANKIGCKGILVVDKDLTNEEVYKKVFDKNFNSGGGFSSSKKLSGEELSKISMMSNNKFLNVIKQTFEAITTEKTVDVKEEVALDIVENINKDHEVEGLGQVEADNE